MILDDELSRIWKDAVAIYFKPLRCFQADLGYAEYVTSLPTVASLRYISFKNTRRDTTLPSRDQFMRRFLIKDYKFRFFMRATCPSHLNFFHVIVLITLYENEQPNLKGIGYILNTLFPFLDTQDCLLVDIIKPCMT